MTFRILTKRVLCFAIICTPIFIVFHKIFNLDIFSTFLSNGFLILLMFIFMDFILKILPRNVLIGVNDSRLNYSNRNYFFVISVLILALIVANFIPILSGGWLHYYIGVAIYVIPHALLTIDNMASKLKNS